MMRWVIASSLKFRLIVVAAAVAALAVGASQLRDMPRDVLPEFVPPTVQIQTEALGLSATEVEQLITVPMEQDLLNGVAFLKDIRSESVPGVSRILMIFEPGTDIFRARQVVAERMTQAVALPHVSKPPQMLQPLSSTSRVMMIGVSSKSVSPLEMSVLARWTIVPRLLGVPGVANVAVWGQRDRQLQVAVDPKRMRDHGVSLLDVLETTGNALWVSPLTFVEASTPGSGGFIDTPNQRLTIQHLSPITKPIHLSNVRIEGTKHLRLGDVATVTEDHQPLIGDAVVNDGRGLMLVVEKFPEANTLDVTQGVENAIAALRPGLSGLQFDTGVYRPASFVESATHHLTVALTIGAILVALLLGAVFMRLRAVAVCAIVVPSSALLGLFVLDAFGATINGIVVLGLVAALALIIDDAVVSVDNVVTRLRRHRLEGGDASAASVILDACLELRRPALYATLMIALATVPVFAMNGVAGSFFPDLVDAYLVALLASMAVALVLTPTLCLLLLGRARLERGGSPLVRWLRTRYEAALSGIVQRPVRAYAAAGALVLAGGLSAVFLSNSLLPNMKEPQLLIPWAGAPGTSLPEMSRITARATRELRSISGVRGVGAHVGRAVTADQIVGVNSGEIWVSVDPGRYDETVRSVRRVVSGYPGLSRDIQTFSNERVNEVLTGSKDDVVVRVYGDELKPLKIAAAKVRTAVADVPGVTRARTLLPAQEPTLEIKVDLEAAQRFGIRPGDVRRSAATLLSGLTAGSLFEKQKVFEVVVRGTPETRNSLTSVRQLLIDTPDGGHARLGDVASVRIAPNPAVITREASSRYLDVALDVGGRGRGAVVGDIQRRIAALSFPLEYHAEVLAKQTQPVNTLLALGVAAAIGIFLLLHVLLGSWRTAAVAFVSLPLGVAGGLVATSAVGGSLSFGSYAALLAIFGIAASNCTLLFDRLRQLTQEGEALGPELVVRASSERFVPILTTAVATVLAMLPLIVLGGSAGLELVQPMAVGLLGGLFATTAVSLFVVPSLYLRFCHAPEPSTEVEKAPELLAAPDAA
jgi:Cu/Ag efflux pump CusA